MNSLVLETALSSNDYEELADMLLDLLSIMDKTDDFFVEHNLVEGPPHILEVKIFSNGYIKN